MSRRRYENGVLIEEIDDVGRIYRRWNISGVLLEQRAATQAEIDGVVGPGGIAYGVGEVRVDGGSGIVLDGGVFKILHDNGSEAVYFGPSGAGDVGITISFRDESGGVNPALLAISRILPGSISFPAGRSMGSMYLDQIYMHGAGQFTISGGVNAPGLYLSGSTGGVTIDATTSSSSANVYMDILGRIYKSVSSRKYKQDIADHDIDPAAVLKMRPRTWRDRGDVKKDNACQRRYVGFISEELHDLGLTEFVEYDADGNPDAIAYDRISVALLTVLKSQQAQIDALTARVDALAVKSR